MDVQQNNLKALSVLVLMITLFLSGCARQQYVETAPPSLAEVQRRDMCTMYAELTPDNPSAFSVCFANPDILSPKLPHILGKLTGPELCALPKPDTNITQAINLSIRKRHINCAKIARDQQIQIIKGSSNPELCQVWSNRTGGNLQSVIDSEVKKRGVRCELILGQMQQQQLFQQQQMQQAIEADRQAQIQMQRNSLLQQQMIQQSLPQSSTTNCSAFGHMVTCNTY